MPTHRSWSGKINRQNKAWIRNWCTRESEPTIPAAPLTLGEIVERDRRAIQEYGQRNRNSGRHYQLTCDRVGPPRTLASKDDPQPEWYIESFNSHTLDVGIKAQEAFDIEVLWPALIQ
jgi:hypothetical protein